MIINYFYYSFCFVFSIGTIVFNEFSMAFLMSRLASFFSLTRFISVQLQIEEISRKLRTGDLGIAPVEERFELINLCIESVIRLPMEFELRGNSSSKGKTANCKLHMDEHEKLKNGKKKLNIND